VGLPSCSLLKSHDGRGVEVCSDHAEPQENELVRGVGCAFHYYGAPRSLTNTEPFHIGNLALDPALEEGVYLLSGLCYQLTG
jgi:hypothetical protein